MFRTMLCVIALTTTAFAQQAADLMPENNEVPGWIKDGDVETAQTPEELYGLIDGAATVYLQYGFVECVFQNYAGTTAGQPTPLDAQVFDQGTTENAHEVFVATATGLETSWDGAGDEARINYLLPFNFVLEFHRKAIQAFAYAMDEVAVPVELVGFTAVRTGTSCTLSWTTATEIDCLGFAVLRSTTDNPAAATVISTGLVPGGGTTAVPRHYRFEDSAPPSGQIYYWLEEHSLSGSTRLLGPAPSAGSGHTTTWGRIKASF
ncbi:MAG: hypothetical protein MUE60_16685 [Candidatus Eisenbacteria bacterium]|nr:hypothetical protein [Candidatus Eisenbacteria bacterium]